MFFIIKFTAAWKNAIVNETEKYYETFSRFMAVSSPTLRITDEGFFSLPVSVEVLQNFLLQFLQSFALQAINHHDGISFFFFSGFKKAKTSSTNLIFCFRRSFTNFKCFMMSHFQARKSEKGSIKRHVTLVLVLTHQCEIGLDYMQ